MSGAARSGKSEWAEAYALSIAEPGSKLVYIATACAGDQEMRRRIEQHKAARKYKGFQTLERYTDVGGAASLLSPGSTVLLECLGTLLANEMFGLGETCAPGAAAPDLLIMKIFGDVLSLSSCASNLLVVSNDIFSDGVTYDETTQTYRRALGALHVKLAGAADLAVECVTGLPRIHKMS